MPTIPNTHEARTQRPVLPWIWLTLSVVLGFYLLTEHRAHLFGVLPFLILLACPLMHIFMHGGHGGHGHGGDPKPQDDPSRKIEP